MQQNTFMPILKKFMPYVLALIVLVIAVAVFAMFADRQGKVQVNITTKPNDALVFINGAITESKTVYLKPGGYLISASKENYITQEKVYEINSDSSDIEIALDNPTEESGKEVEKLSEIQSKLPITSTLPYKNIFYTINYTVDDNLENLVIFIKSYDGYKHVAIDKIKSWGYNPAEYNIVFEEYVNPFKS